MFKFLNKLKSHKQTEPEVQNHKNIRSMLKSLFIPRIVHNSLNHSNHSTSLLQAPENQMVHNIDAFYNKTVLDVMVPRSDIISASHKSSFDEICDLIIKHSHTRTLVYKERLDNIIGFIHIKDLFEISAHKKKFTLKQLIRKHIISPHSMKLIDLLIQMQIHRTHIAVVVDEYGGTDGIVTIEDIIEEIVGRIDDEHDIDEENQDYQIITPGVLVANSRVEIKTLEQILGVNLRESTDEFDTIGGLVITKMGHVPHIGDTVDLGKDITASIIDATPRNIKKIKITYTT